MGACDLYAGAALLDDGRVALVLHPPGLAPYFGVTGNDAAPLAIGTLAEPPSSAMRILLFNAGAGIQKAIPLAQVTRVETMEQSAILRNGAAYSVAYQGAQLRLITVPGRTMPTASSFEVVVLHGQAPRIGIAVEAVLDIVEAHPVPLFTETDSAVPGSILLAGKSIDLLDAAYLRQQCEEVA